MKQKLFVAAFAAVFAASCMSAQTSSRAGSIVLGRLQTGATVSFIPFGTRAWGIEISGEGAPHLTQEKPAQVEVYAADGATSDLSAAYEAVRKQGAEIVATAHLTGAARAALTVEDRWKITGPELSLSRHVIITSGEDRAGFYSGIRLRTAPATGRRGLGSHRSWLPWVSANHLHGITGLEQFDAALYERLSK